MLGAAAAGRARRCGLFDARRLARRPFGRAGAGRARRRRRRRCWSAARARGRADRSTAAIPIADLPNPAAQPFTLRGADEAARARALECLTSAVYYEAGNESADGQQAVAQVVLNRVRHPAFPSSVCGVVYQGSTRATGCQFTFTCDGSLARRAERRRLGPGAQGRRGGARRRGLCPGRLRDPLSRQLRRSLLGLEPGQERGRRRAHLLSLGRRLGPPARVRQALSRRTSRAPARCAARRSPPKPRSRGAAGRRVDEIAAIPGAETEARRERRPSGRGPLQHGRAQGGRGGAARELCRKFEASDNLRWTLGGGRGRGDRKAARQPPAAGRGRAAAAPARPPQLNCGIAGSAARRLRPLRPAAAVAAATA